MVQFTKDFTERYNAAPIGMMNQTEYRRAYRTRHKRIEIVCECEEYDLLKNSARKHGRKLSPFILECAFSYLNEGFILPDEEAVSELKRELRRWGNNLNQIAYHANRTQQVSARDIAQTIRLVQTLETRLDQLFREPKSLRKAIEEQVKDDPELIPRIRFLLDQFSK